MRYKCLAYITKAYGILNKLEQTQTADQLVDNVSTACTTYSHQLLSVSTTLFQQLNDRSSIYRQVSITQMNKPVHMYQPG